MPAPFVTLDLSAFQLGASIVVVFAAVALAYLVGLGEGRERFRQQLVEQAREDGVKALRLLRRHRGG